MWLGIGLVGSGYWADPVAAQAYSNFPYVSDFGTSAAPGGDNALYQFTSEFGTPTGWAMEAMTDNALYPTFTVNEDDMNATLVTRPFRFEQGFTYRLTVVYETDAVFSDANYYWRLAPENSAAAEGYDIIYSPDADANLIAFNESGFSAGEQLPVTYDFSPGVSGNYALSFTFYAQNEIFDDGLGRKLRIKSIQVSEKSPYDLAMGKIVTPVSHYSADPQTVSAWVRNDGSAPVADFTLCYTVGAQTVVKQTFNQSIAVNGEVLVSFDQKAVLSSGSNRIRVFLTDRPSGDPAGNDTAASAYVSIYDEPYQVPFSFGFDNNTLNQRWTVLYDAHTDQTAWRFGLQNDKACAYINTANTGNNARLASPGIRLDAGKTYRFRFHYTGLSAAAEKLSAYMTDADFMDESRMAGYWKDEGFTDNSEQTATFFYTASAAGVHHLVLKAHSDDISGGIAVWNLEVDSYEPTRGDFYYEFDPMSADVTAAALLASSAYFMDKNHNGQAWRLVNA
ncbi:MAG: hypothetical protein K2O01_07305, partial [Bacteroidales bacterium]|nr:hypothetical protein [Bacteroidales bacterium]